MERARSAFYEAAELARDAIKVRPAMSIVAGDAELLIASSLLATNHLERVPGALRSAEAAYLGGVMRAAESIRAVDDATARAHFMAHAPNRPRLAAKLGSSNATWWPSLRELQAPLAEQLSECLRRLNIFRSNLKTARAAPAECQLVLPVTNHTDDPYFEENAQLPLGVHLRSLSLATGWVSASTARVAVKYWSVTTVSAMRARRGSSPGVSDVPTEWRWLPPTSRRLVGTAVRSRRCRALVRWDHLSASDMRPAGVLRGLAGSRSDPHLWSITGPRRRVTPWG
jgi:hypothetical protein